MHGQAARGDLGYPRVAEGGVPMDKQQALKIVEGLRKARAAGAPVVELEGAEARDFAFVKDEAARKVLLGSFGVEAGKKFFLSVVSTPRSDDDFQFFVFEKLKGQPVLMTNLMEADGLVWKYQPSKQQGDNQARKRAFLEAAKQDGVTIPAPDDLVAFSAAINRAIEWRHLADAAGGAGAGDEEAPDDAADPSELVAQLFTEVPERAAAARLLAASIRVAHANNPKSWCVTNPGGRELIRLNVGNLRVLDLLPGQVEVVVDPDKLTAALIESWGEAWKLEPDEIRFPYGRILTTPSAASALPDEVRHAHEAFVTRAAALTTPYARFHQPTIIDEVETILGEQLPAPAAPQTRYWKISPGENADQWEAWRDGGFIAIGWNRLGDLTSVTHDEFKQRAEEKEASSQVWKFRNIEVGDRIVANDGFFRVLGIGTVIGPYRFVEGARHAHQMPVRWDDTHERRVEMRGWRRTLIRLSHDAFKQLEAAPLADAALRASAEPGKGKVEAEAGPKGGIDFDGILAQLASVSLSFSAELVASYLLALQAKRFVLLTGISGTGKTRLAQEISRVFGPIVEQAPTAAPDTFEVVAKPSQLKYARFIVPSQLAQEFDALTNPATKRIDLKVPGLPKTSMAFHKNPERGNLFYLLLSGEAKEWFTTNIKLGDRFLLSRKTSGEKEWLDLTLPSGDQPSSAASDKSYELIAVRPDWTDARALLGFYNPLTKIYISTPTLQLLLRAHAEVKASTDAAPPRPFFLIFDEMNLARVEHYFSDFLSAMESGEAIHLHDDPQVEEEEDIPRRIEIPKNVFVIGTVNVDETTYMFSPKVLDRAFVLEFNDVDLKGLAGAVHAESSESTPLALVNLEGGLKLRGPATDAEWQRFERVLGGAASALLHKLHAALAIENRHFGYRVAREVARFVVLAVELAGESEAAARAALDVAVLAKILPKLHGSQAEIEQTLRRLMSIAIDGKPELGVFSEHGAVLDATAVLLPRTARKLWRMQRRLRAHGFVSFIE
jgi:5-methylcytosine-specific restriction enzyme B